MVGSQVEIDETDVKILEAFLKDARTSFADIARDCGVSTNTIVKRFRKLKKSGVITGTSMIVKMEDFGYQFSLSVDLIVEAGEESHILEELKKMPNIRSCYEVVGKYDIHSVFHIKSFDEIDRIRDDIKKTQSS